MERTQIDRWSGRYPLAGFALCVAQATSLAGHQVATAAQNEPEEVVVTSLRIRQNPVEMTAADIDCSGEISIADSLQSSWTPPIFEQQLQRAPGVDNLLDEDPPPCLSCDFNNCDGTLYPEPGRFFHARAAINF